MQTLFFAYANSQSTPLKSLSREDETVYNILMNRYLKGHYLIHRDSYTNLQKINHSLGKFLNNIAVFSYSGHAGKDGLHFDNTNANAQGIAYQLGESARAGVLKLVILNGCSTGGQVNNLLDQEVPVVVATSAPVEDQSATEFAIRFFQCLVEKRLTIKEAFDEALGPAQTATERDLQLPTIARGVGRRQDREDQPVWGLFCKDPNHLNTNPIPSGHQVLQKSGYVPNEALTETLFNTLAQTGNRQIRALQDAEEDGEYVETGNKQTTIVNVLPYPVAVHLQKLLCPIELENEGFDDISLRRLEQTGRVFQTSIEFLTFIMLAQLWEHSKMGLIGPPPAHLLEALRRYFYASQQERQVMPYLALIKLVHDHLDTFSDSIEQLYFVKELADLRPLLSPDHAFASACAYLNGLQKQIVHKQIAETDIADFCEEAEMRLCEFFSQLGFLHRYTLTSIQNIDIQKYRHQHEATFNHELVKLMRAFGKPEHNYYLLPDFLDNRGVVLVKGKMKMIDPRKKQFEGEALQFLNLSPFLIDRNAFEDNTDLSNLLYFDFVEADGSAFHYRNVKRPDSRRDRLVVALDGPFSVVGQQLEAFRTILLNEEQGRT